VLAHQVAKAEAVATYADQEGKPDNYTASMVTWPGSGVTTLNAVEGRTFAYSDPASTSGHLFPAYGLSKAGIDPDRGIKPVYAGSHTASFEALHNHKVQAGELNGPEISSATAAGIYKASDFVVLWTSDPIPQDPITVRGDLREPLKTRLAQVLAHLDLSAVPAKERAVIGLKGDGLVPQTDAAYDGIRDLVSVLHLDLKKMNE